MTTTNDTNLDWPTVRAAFDGQFMQPECWHASFTEVETTHGTEIVPDDVCNGNLPQDFADYCEGKPVTIERKTGLLYRLSAPGYTDCTETSYAFTRQEAFSALMEMAD